MRRAARVDDNQAEIVAALERLGATVTDLSAVGGGVPDLLVGFRGRNFLIECKDGKKRPSDRRLTDRQVDFMNSWVGHAEVANSVDEAIKIVLDGVQEFPYVATK